MDNLYQLSNLYDGTGYHYWKNRLYSLSSGGNLYAGATNKEINWYGQSDCREKVLFHLSLSASMGKKGAIYERELKGILSGDKKIIDKILKKLDDEERENYMKIVDRPFMVLRAAGSLGVDLIAIRNDFSFPIEVKSSKSKILRFTQNSSRGQKQAEGIIRECEKTGVIALYAFRLKSYRGDPWRMFCLPLKKKPMGWMGYIYEILPKVSLTKEGNYILHWDDGMPLSRFISYLNYKKEDENEVDN